MVLFAAVLVVVFYRAIFLGDVLASVDLLSKDLPWRAVLPTDTRISNFTAADSAAIFYPWKHFVHDELRAGRFPLWCKYVGCGYPLAGEGMIKLYGLTTLFLWLAPPPIASWLTFSAQLLIGMTGLYALLCAFRVRWPAAVFGGFVFGLNSAMFQHLEFEHVVGGLVFLPWICWALWRASDPGGARARFLGLGGLFFGLCILHGSLQSALMVWLSASGFAAGAVWRRERPRFWRNVFGAIVVFSILGLLVAAVSLVPNLELLAHNTRARFEHIGWAELVWKRPLVMLAWLAAHFNPDVLGNMQTFDLVRGLGRVGTLSATASITDVRVYCGLAAAVLALFGLRARGDARAMGLWLVIVPVAMVVISPLFLLIYFRGFAACACGVAILAALGLERILEQDVLLKRDVRLAVGGLIVAAGMVVAGGTVVTVKREPLTREVEQVGLKGTSHYKADVGWQQEKARETVRNFSLRGNVVLRFCVFALAVALLLEVAPRHAVAAAVLCVALNVVDLVEVAWRTIPIAPHNFDYPPTPALEFLQRQPGEFRIGSSWDGQTEPPTASANVLMVYGLDDARVYESLFPKNPLLDTQDWSALNVRFFIVPPDAVSPNARWRRVFHGEVDVYENSGAAPRVSFTRNLADGTAEAAGIRIGKYVSGHISLSVNAPESGWLIVRERLYPGWHATVNGRPVDLREAQGLWQAVAVPAGNGQVELRYCPRSVEIGAAATCAGLLVVVVLWRYGRRSSI